MHQLHSRIDVILKEKKLTLTVQLTHKNVETMTNIDQNISSYFLFDKKLINVLAVLFYETKKKKYFN